VKTHLIRVHCSCKLVVLKRQ